MPSQVALLLCSGFVLMLLRMERKQTPEVSHAVWIPTLWMLYCISKPFGVWFGAVRSGTSVEEGSPLDRNFLIVLMALGSWVIANRRLDWATLKRDNTWLLVICVYALVSIVWSEFPFVSLKRYIRFLGTIIMALVLMSDRSPKLALENVLRRTAYILIPYSLLLIKFYPAFGVMYGRYTGDIMWVGTASQKNGLGVLCSVSIIFLFWRQLRAWQRGNTRDHRWSKYLDASLLFLSVYLLRGPSNAAASKTSFVVLAVGCSCLLGLLWMKNHRRYLGQNSFLAVVLLAYIYGFGVPFGLTSLFSGLVQAIGRDATFTGRTEIWAELIPIASSDPFLGLGYGGFWVRPIESQVNEAHNGYLDVMLELGLVGVLLLLAFVISMCRAAYAMLRRDFWWASFGLSFLLMAVLHNASESTFLKTSDFLWTLVVFLSMLMPLTGQREAAAKESQQISKHAPDIQEGRTRVESPEAHAPMGRRVSA
jgi:exopolysaccharide production protein ExoQ